MRVARIWTGLSRAVVRAPSSGEELVPVLASRALGRGRLPRGEQRAVRGRRSAGAGAGPGAAGAGAGRARGSGGAELRA